MGFGVKKIGFILIITEFFKKLIILMLVIILTELILLILQVMVKIVYLEMNFLPPPRQLGGKNSIITFENGEFTINNIISGVEDNLYQRYFCSGSFWMYPIDIDGDGIDEVVTQSEIIKFEDNSYSLSSLMEGKYASQNFLINESGFVIDIDNDGDEDLIKGGYFN